MSEQPSHVDQPENGPDATVLSGPWLPALDEDRIIDGQVVTDADPARVGLDDESPRRAGGAVERRRPGTLVRVDATAALARPAVRVADVSA